MADDLKVTFPPELLSEATRYNPFTYLLEKANKTDIPLVYQNPQRPFIKNQNLPTLVIIIGPSGSGKDTILAPLVEKQLVGYAVTATSRKRRVEEGEPETAHIWMRAQNENESIDAYIENLVKEYNLVEHDFHHEALYGVPKASLEEAMKEKVGLVRVEVDGAKTISRELQGKANILIVFITPDSFEEIWQRIHDRNNSYIRLKESIDWVKEAPSLANYYLYNHQNGEDGIPQAQQALEDLIRKEVGLP